MDGVYLTWLISALAIGVLLMPIIKPPWAIVTGNGFIDFLRRYWIHILIVLSIYNAKDFLDVEESLQTSRAPHVLLVHLPRRRHEPGGGVLDLLARPHL